ncbi:MAG: hypothetical protein FWG34_11380 [Oscillospiraceae bacterium]|nr:hypothetical protein [Oscillospiraceae bacterium]
MLKIDLSQKLGEFKPINGIDNGPVCFGSLIDSSKYYKKAGFPYCRLHDTNYPHPREVDIPTIFKDFSADENDPASYDFRATDIYLNEILETGAKIIYRLGASIEHPKLKYHTHPPADFDKWARVCLNVARHCNEDWAHGHHMGIEYWEVWNEPDFEKPDRENDQMWSGTRKQYFELYSAVSRLFGKEMPNVNIGGYAACNFGTDYFPSFLQYVKNNNLPLDFFSWHTYTTSISAIKENARHIRDTLDKFGFAGVPAVLDEWNCISWNSLWGDMFGADGDKSKYEIFAEASGEVGAAFTAAALIEMLDLPIDIATFYDGHPTNIFCTIFDRYGQPTKQYHAFEAFNKMKQTGVRVHAKSDSENIYIAAAASGDNRNICILIANNGSRNGFYRYEIEGLQENAEYACEIYLTDKHRAFEKFSENTCAKTEIPNSVYLYRHSFALICLSAL